MRGIGQILYSVIDHEGRLIMTAPTDTIVQVLGIDTNVLEMRVGPGQIYKFNDRRCGELSIKMLRLEIP